MVRYRVILGHYVGFEPYDEERAELARHDAELIVIERPAETVSDTLLASCDALLNIGWRVPAALMDRMPQCRLIVVYGIGTDAVDLAAASQRGIVVSNLPLVAVDDVANHAITLLLASLRRIPQLDAAVHRGVYDWRMMRPAHNPHGRVLGLVSLGNTARSLARKMAAAFDMQLIAYAPTIAPAIADELHVRLVSLPELMSQADLISVHVPLNERSRGMIGETELRLMKPTAHLVVVGRGHVVDETALVRALREGWIAGAALDVQAHEPLPPDDPLLTAPNLILTPHCAGHSEESWWAMKRLACEAVCRVLAGHWPQWVVNPGVIPRIPLIE
jgi:D-3-phosphoglycerate dehydrogenase